MAVWWRLCQWRLTGIDCEIGSMPILIRLAFSASFSQGPGQDLLDLGASQVQGFLEVEKKSYVHTVLVTSRECAGKKLVRGLCVAIVT